MACLCVEWICYKSLLAGLNSMENLKSVQIRAEIIWVALCRTCDKSRGQVGCWDKAENNSSSQRVTHGGRDVNNRWFSRNWKEESDQEFVALCALLLCGDLTLKQDTFQAITNKHEVSFDLYCVILRFATQKTMALMWQLWHGKMFYQENR